MKKIHEMLAYGPKCHQILSNEINNNKTLCYINKSANISKKNTNNSKQDIYQYKLVLREMIYIFLIWH